MMAQVDTYALWAILCKACPNLQYLGTKLPTNFSGFGESTAWDTTGMSRMTTWMGGL